METFFSKIHQIHTTCHYAHEQIGQFVITFQTTLHDPPNNMSECVSEPHRDCFCLCMGAYLHESSKGFLPWQWSKADWKSDCRLAKNGSLVEGKAVILLSVDSVCVINVCRRRCLYFTHTISVARYVPQTYPDRPQTCSYLLLTYVLSDGTATATHKIQCLAAQKLFKAVLHSFRIALQ